MAGPFVYGSFNPATKNPFRMNFAPHLGMFRGHAGEDPLDQLDYPVDRVEDVAALPAFLERLSPRT